MIHFAFNSLENSFAFSPLMQQRFVEHNDKPKQRVQKKSVVDDSTFGKFMKSSSSKSLETNESFVGKSTALEKAYMRLTSAPKAEDVRPLPVLKMALDHVKAHFVEHEDFDFANEQLKSKFIDKRRHYNEMIRMLLSRNVYSPYRNSKQAFDRISLFSICAIISFWKSTRPILGSYWRMET